MITHHQQIMVLAYPVAPNGSSNARNLNANQLKEVCRQNLGQEINALVLRSYVFDQDDSSRHDLPVGVLSIGAMLEI